MADISPVDALFLVKWIMAGLLAVGVLIVLGACALDLGERRRWRAMVPDAWPPPGAWHDELEADPTRREVSS